MANFVAVPAERLGRDVLLALLEEFASRDGTDYGNYELTLQGKVDALHNQLQRADLQLLYDADSEQWDLVSHENAAQLLAN